MKKIFLFILLTALCLSCISCGNNSETQATETEPKLAAPQVQVVGNVAFWQPIEGAESYEVSYNNQVLTTTTDCYYIYNEVESTGQITVIAKSSKSVLDSDKSQAAAIYKSTNFTDQETQNIVLSDGQKYNVAPNINYIELSGTAQKSSVIIADRTTDIVIKLKDVTLESASGMGCITTADGDYDSSKKNFSALIIVEGVNVLKGTTDTSVPEQPKANSEKDGTKGVDGGSGIILPKVAFSGSGSITLFGGNGGIGGRGADSSGWVNAVFGEGGDGGNGGYGIKSSIFVLAMDIGGICKCSGGVGGKGGMHGANGSVITGPIYSAAGNFGRYEGTDGENGGSMLGEFKQIQGVYIDS